MTHNEYTQRIKKINILNQIGEDLEKQRNKWLEVLINIETKATAVDEIDKTIRALKSYSKEISLIEDRKGIGLFYVSLPCNNPIYSFVLYTCGIALVGNTVIVRASKMTSKYVSVFYETFKKEFESIGIILYEGSGKNFISRACQQKSPGGLLFTGSYDNLQNIIQQHSPNQHLIYCGQGINPLVVGKDVINMKQIVNIVINSRIYNSGQDCLCSEKIIVHDKIYDDFCNELVLQLEKLKIGTFGDMKADIFPPIPGLEKFVSSCHTMVSNEGKTIFEKSEQGATLAAYEVPLESHSLNCEKFSPLFTIAKYNSEKQLVPISKSAHKFGAIILAGANPMIWEEFPHVVTEGTVMQLEALDAHIPFGGKGKSGFSKCNNYYKDGPILFSIESSVKIKNN